MMAIDGNGNVNPDSMVKALVVHGKSDYPHVWDLDKDISDV